MSLSLNCLVLGDDPDCLFTIEVPKTDNVSILQSLIREENPSSLGNIDVKDINLWQVSLPVDDSFETALGDIDLSVHRKLSPSFKTLDTFFTDVDDDCLHVIAKVPDVQTTAALGSNQLLSLNCLIFGDDPDRLFTVEIPKTENVSILKDLIKKKMAPHLDHVAASELHLWEVSFPIEKLPSENPALGPMLRPEMLLSRVFPSMLPPDHLHVVARVPRFPVISGIQVAWDRATFCRERKPQVPSHSDATYTPCNRPRHSPQALPLSLLHPIFGEFLDDAENQVPTPDDAKLFVEFVEAMADMYTSRDNRLGALVRIFQDHGIPIQSTTFPGYLTDGDLSYKHFRYLMAAINNEIGDTATDPYFRALRYSIETSRDHAPQCFNSVLPCIVVLIFGPYVAFAGVAWTNRPNIQMLSPAIPCHYQDGDLKMETMLVRHLAALRRAIHSLESYYEAYDRDQAKFVRHPAEPYPNSFTSKDGSKKNFFLTHSNGPESRLLFFGQMNDTRMSICVKFVPSYCKEGHEFFAAKGFAPKLHAVERLPGGWFMVVMDDVSDQYVSLYDFTDGRLRWDWLEEHPNARDALLEKLKTCLHQFHDAGFVHGDIRDTNIMVKRSGFDDGSFLLVDYDSSGEQGKVRYPLNLNIYSVWRPEGAIGGADIKTEHDFKMLEHIWESYQ